MRKKSTTFYAVVLADGTLVWHSALDRPPEGPAIFPKYSAASQFRKRVAKDGIFSMPSMRITTVKVVETFRA